MTDGRGREVAYEPPPRYVTGCVLRNEVVVGGNFNRALAYDVRLTVEMKDDAERVGGGVMRRKGLAAVLGARLLSTLVEVEKWLKTADTSACGVRLCGGEGRNGAE